MKEALEAARSIQSEVGRQLFYSGFEENIDYLMDGIIKQLVVFLSTEGMDSQVISNEFVNRWHHFIWEEPDEEIKFLKRSLWIMAKDSRRMLLQQIRNLSTVILFIGEDRAISETLQAIRDTAEWWP
jgi:hypothetical protein